MTSRWHMSSASEISPEISLLCHLHVIHMSSARHLHVVCTRLQLPKYFQLNSRTALLKMCQPSIHQFVTGHSCTMWIPVAQSVETLEPPSLFGLSLTSHKIIFYSLCAWNSQNFEQKTWFYPIRQLYEPPISEEPQEDPLWLWNPGEMSQEFQTRDISGCTKAPMSSNKLTSSYPGWIKSPHVVTCHT